MNLFMIIPLLNFGTSFVTVDISRPMPYIKFGMNMLIISMKLRYINVTYISLW